MQTESMQTERRKTQDAGPERSYSDFSVSEERAPWERRPLGPQRGAMQPQSSTSSQGVAGGTTAVKGVSNGAWMLENAWSIEVEKDSGGDSRTERKTETQEVYKTHVNHVAATKVKKAGGDSNYKFGADAVDYSSVTKADFPEKKAEMRAPIVPKVAEHEKPLPEYTEITRTTSKEHFPGRSAKEANETFPAGNATTVMSTYNIITGAKGNERSNYEGYQPHKSKRKLKTPGNGSKNGFDARFSLE